MEGGKKLEALLDDMERAAALIHARQTSVWLMNCQRDAYILRSHSGDLYTRRGDDVVHVTKDPTVCVAEGHGACRCYPTFNGTLMVPGVIYEVAEAAKALGGPEGWAKAVANHVRFDGTIWRLWMHVWWSKASTSNSYDIGLIPGQTPTRL